jgi:hypothetical protein
MMKKNNQVGSFRSEIRRASRVFSENFSVDVEVALKACIDKAVRDFFTLRGPPVVEPSVVGQSAVPEGFTRLGFVSDAPWFALVAGNKMTGRLLGKYSRENVRVAAGRTYFYQVELTSPTLARFGKGERARFAEAGTGRVVSLNASPSLLALDALADDVVKGSVHHVSIECQNKIELMNGNTMWKMVVAVKKAS